MYWDPVDKTVLAEEQVDSNMTSWRSGAKVEKKLLQQWFIKTTVFAERLAKGLVSGDLKHGWRDVVDLQKHWVGEIKGFFTDYTILLENEDGNLIEEPLRIWFSNLDSLKNANFLLLNPDHYLVQDKNAVEKTFPNGIVQLKTKIRNPVTGKVLPVFSSGSPETVPWIPESCDCRVDETLTAEEYPQSEEREALMAGCLEAFQTFEVIFFDVRCVVRVY